MAWLQWKSSYLSLPSLALPLPWFSEKNLLIFFQTNLIFLCLEKKPLTWRIKVLFCFAFPVVFSFLYKHYIVDTFSGAQCIFRTLCFSERCVFILVNKRNQYEACWCSLKVQCYCLNGFIFFSLLCYRMTRPYEMASFFAILCFWRISYHCAGLYGHLNFYLICVFWDTLSVTLIYDVISLSLFFFTQEEILAKIFKSSFHYIFPLTF